MKVGDGCAASAMTKIRAAQVIRWTSERPFLGCPIKASLFSITSASIRSPSIVKGRKRFPVEAAYASSAERDVINIKLD
jgi:hypothetical protein